MEEEECAAWVVDDAGAKAGVRDASSASLSFLLEIGMLLLPPLPRAESGRFCFRSCSFVELFCNEWIASGGISSGTAEIFNMEADEASCCCCCCWCCGNNDASSAVPADEGDIISSSSCNGFVPDTAGVSTSSPLSCVPAPYAGRVWS